MAQSITHAKQSGLPADSGVSTVVQPTDWYAGHVLTGVPLANSTTTDPTVNDDTGDGYEPGSIWMNTALGIPWICISASSGAAVWHSLVNPYAFVSGFNSASSASTTALAITSTAYAAGTNLTLTVGSRTAKPSSISQTNVTWTERLNTSGNNQHLTFYTGVVAGGNAGTTCTVNFAVARLVQAEILKWDDAATILGANFTTVTNIANSTAAATAAAALNAGPTLGGFYLWAVSANAPTSSYSGGNISWRHTGLATGGTLRQGAFRANGPSTTMFSISSSAVDYLIQIVRLT